MLEFPVMGYIILTLMPFTETMPSADDYNRPMMYMNSDIYHRGPRESFEDIRKSGATLSQDWHIYALRRKSPKMIALAMQAVYAAGELMAPQHYSWNNELVRDDFIESAVNGIKAGLLIASEVHGEDFPLDMALKDGLPVDTDDDNGQIAYDQSITLGLIRHGTHGLALIGEANQHYLERWAPEFVVGPHPYYRAASIKGFGAAVMGAWNVQAEIARQRESVSDGN